MNRLYWIIIDEDEPVTPVREYVYVVRRETKGLEFIFKTRDLALKCAKRLEDMYPEESGITVKKMAVRSQYN